MRIFECFRNVLLWWHRFQLCTRKRERERPKNGTVGSKIHGRLIFYYFKLTIAHSYIKIHWATVTNQLTWLVPKWFFCVLLAFNKLCCSQNFVCVFFGMLYARWKQNEKNHSQIYFGCLKMFGRTIREIPNVKVVYNCVSQSIAISLPSQIK